MLKAFLNRSLPVLFVALLTLVAACQPKVFGVAYIDDNANQVMDGNEQRLSYAKYVVTLGSETVAEGVADSTGSFVVKATEPGYYCAEITATTASSASTSVAKSGAASVSKAATSSTTDTDSDGKMDSVDDDIDNDGYLNGNDNCRKIANSDQLDTDNDGFGDECDLCPETDNEDTDDDGKADACDGSSSVEEKDPTVEYGKACTNVKGTSVDIAVPVKRDYLATVNSLPVEETIAVKAGESTTVSFQYPSACNSFSTVSLDPLLQSASVWRFSAQANTSILNLNAAASVTQTIGTANVASSGNTLATVNFPLIADPSFIGEKKVTIKLTANCPDNETKYVVEKTVKVTGKYPLSTSCSLPSVPSSAAKSIVLKCTVMNTSDADLGEIELRAGVKDYYSLISVSEDISGGLGGSYKCSKLGMSGLCIFSLVAKEERSFNFTFDISSRVGMFESYADTTIVNRPDIEAVEVKDVSSWAPQVSSGE